MAEWLLYEHEDGRHAAAPDAATAALAFTSRDPRWHRVGPVEVPTPPELLAAASEARQFLCHCAEAEEPCCERQCAECGYADGVGLNEGSNHD